VPYNKTSPLVQSYSSGLDGTSVAIKILTSRGSSHGDVVRVASTGEVHIIGSAESRGNDGPGTPPGLIVWL